ncbi:unnamed protein product, partial [Amoebophrya sp. A25]
RKPTGGRDAVGGLHQEAHISMENGYGNPSASSTRFGFAAAICSSDQMGQQDPWFWYHGSVPLSYNSGPPQNSMRWRASYQHPAGDHYDHDNSVAQIFGHYSSGRAKEFSAKSNNSSRNGTARAIPKTAPSASMSKMLNELLKRPEKVHEVAPVPVLAERREGFSSSTTNLSSQTCSAQQAEEDERERRLLEGIEEELLEMDGEKPLQREVSEQPPETTSRSATSTDNEQTDKEEYQAVLQSSNDIKLKSTTTARQGTAKSAAGEPWTSSYDHLRR